MHDDSLRLPLGDFVSWFCDTARVDDQEIDGQMDVRALQLELPVELSVGHDEAGRLAVYASPPTQRVATTFLPVFHRMALRIEREEHIGDGG
jgi:hypothetical protein